MNRERLVPAAAFLLFFAACSLPWVGLWNPNGVADTGLYGLYGGHMADGFVPYRDFFVEFPPGALPALVLPALPGSHYVAWFHALEFLFGLGSLACLVVILRRLAPPDRWTAPLVVAAIAPAVLGPITLNSFDYWPTLLVTGAVAALVTERPRTGFVLLGLATSAKLFPAALLPLALLYVLRRGQGWKTPVVAYITTVFVIFAPFAILAPGGLRFSLRTQLFRGLQLESLGASLLATAHHVWGYAIGYTPNRAYAEISGGTASVVAALTSIVMLAAVVVVARRYHRGGDTDARFVFAAAATLVGVVAFAKVLSPQYLLWFVPLVSATWLATQVAPVLLLVALALTRIWVPDRFDDLQRLNWVTWIVLARNVVLVALFLVLVAVVRPEPRTARQRADLGAPRATPRHRGRTG